MRSFARRFIAFALALALTAAPLPSATPHGEETTSPPVSAPAPVLRMQPDGRVELDARRALDATLGGLPEWLARVRGSFDWDSEAGSRGAIETIQPLWRAPLDRHVLFVQGRFAFADGDETLNLGLGWRHLLPSRDWILGVNGFYDRTFGHDHQRLGLGLEAIGRQLAFRANGYLGVSGWQDVAGSREERVLDGFDAELEGPLPWLPWARIAAGHYFWKRRTGRDLHGFRGRARLQLTPQLSLETGYAVDRDDDAGFVQLRVRLAGDAQVEHAASRRFWSDRAFEPRDLRRHTLAFVERSNEVAVERRNTGAGGGRARVIVARGS